MSLIEIDLPNPKEMMSGWAALASISATRGWTTDVYATPDSWHFHDGGGNWAILRRIDKDKIVLIGNDHEYTETYFREAAEYFEEEETDLLLGAPDWWSKNLETGEFENWIGFIYGWDGEKWRRAEYDKEDGFNDLGLLKVCRYEPDNMIKEFALNAPGLNGEYPDDSLIKSLYEAKANITHELLNAVVPGWDIDAGVLAAKKFLEMEL